MSKSKPKPSPKAATPKMACLLITESEKAALRMILKECGVFPANRSNALRYCISSEFARVSGNNDESKYDGILEKVLASDGVAEGSGRGSERAAAGVKTEYVPFKLPPQGRVQLERIQKEHGLQSYAATVRCCIRVTAMLCGYKPAAKGWL